jgi:predicted nucleic acid-binding protein
LVLIVVPAVIAPTITRDPADDQVFAAALTAQVDLIVSGDAHLLDLKSFQDIEIVTAATAVERINNAA